MLNKSVCKTHDVPYSMNSAQKRCDNFLGTRTLIIFCHQCMWLSFYLEGVDSLSQTLNSVLNKAIRGAEITWVQHSSCLQPLLGHSVLDSSLKDVLCLQQRCHSPIVQNAWFIPVQWGQPCVLFVVACWLAWAFGTSFFPSFFFFSHWLYIVHELCLMFCNTKDCNIFFFFTDGFSINSERRHLCQCVFHPAI